MSKRGSIAALKQDDYVYEKGYFPVDGGHNLYYERFGNPAGIPIVFLHGGPGAGCNPADRADFDPRLHHVLFFDQRGAGRSEPFASLDNNTTEHLISDISNLISHFGMAPAILYGGSWGSTLALVYAIRFPEQVRALLLRGIFLASEESIRYYVGGGVAQFFPEAWQRFVAQVPEKHRKSPVSFYLNRMQSPDDKIREHYAYEWAFYEFSIYRLQATAEQIKSWLGQYSWKSLAALEAHYMDNACFLEDNYILANANRIAHIPTSIVHGRYDMICPPEYAFMLQKQMRNAQLHFVTAGHASSEPEISARMRLELKRLAV